jgi:cell division septum initiation protein DivIVA
MENNNETVTLSLKTYEDMKEEIKNLKEQVKEKTIIKYSTHPVYGYVALSIMFALFIWVSRM